MAIVTASFSKRTVWLTVRGYNAILASHGAVLWTVYTGACVQLEMGCHPVNIITSWVRGCLPVLQILLLNIVGMPVCSTDGWKQ